MRNLAVAIGNSGDAEALRALGEDTANRPSANDEMVREHVEWAMEESQKVKVKSQK